MIWLNETSYVTLKEYVVSESRKVHANLTEEKELESKVEETVKKYQQIHRDLLGDKTDGIYREMSWEVNRINRTILVL